MSSPASGLVVVDKPGGLTSHDVVGRVRRLAGTRRVGHAGTLDPMATGVLLLGVNRATRLLGQLTLAEKEYDAVVRLGMSTTTDDAEGEATATCSAAHLTEPDIRVALEKFTGTIAQVPSSVSAVKVGGQRAYKRVRAGEEVMLAARTVTIHRLEAGAPRVEGEVVDLPITVRCSSGTYVRAIARDLGAALGVGGHLVALRRTAVGPFGLDEAATLDALAEDFTMLSMETVARRCFPALDLDEAQAGAVAHGRPLELDLGSAGAVAVFAPDGDFLALYDQHGPLAKAVAVFA
ncbi:MAG TPA: tRNA pseudouridine(55) synthase TruB [Nocardioidaceae bacterium]|nr:tRNA pseudouridine(55) synthase TruB [Nocardioidaceae bacterium]